MDKNRKAVETVAGLWLDFSCILLVFSIKAERCSFVQLSLLKKLYKTKVYVHAF